jgi:hypothetical protein
MPLQYPQLFKGLLSPWGGVLLYGPPGAWLLSSRLSMGGALLTTSAHPTTDYRHGQDPPGQGGGLAMPHDVLQHIGFVHREQVPGRLGEAGARALRPRQASPLLTHSRVGMLEWIQL